MVFGFFLMLVPPHFWGVLFLVFVLLREGSKQWQKEHMQEERDMQEEDRDAAFYPARPDGDSADVPEARPDFGRLFNDPVHIKDQEDLR